MDHASSAAHCSECDVLEEILKMRDLNHVMENCDRLLGSLFSLVPNPPALETKIEQIILKSLRDGPLSPHELMDRTNGQIGDMDLESFATLVVRCLRSLNARGQI